MVGWIFAHYGVPLARFAVVSAVLIAGILLGVRAFYTHVVVAPYTKDQALKRLLTDPQPATVYGDLPPELEQGAEGPAGLTQIEERGVLRVCFAPDAYPTSFYNDAEPPQLVGFDIEMAHRFASSIELPIAFIATSVERDAVKRLESGACDILMRSTRLGPDTTQQYRMTSPVYESAVGIMIRDHRRSEVQTWDAIRGLGDSMRIAIDGSPGSLRFMTALLPQPELLPLYDAKEFVSIMESGAPNAPAIAGLAEETAAWTLLFPTFSYVVPQPPLFIPLSYAVARRNTDLQIAFDAWLVAEKAKGAIDAVYRHWMLGEATRINKPPRWSVIRNVLRWVH